MNSEFDWLAPLVEAGPIPGLARPLDVVWSVPKTSGGEAAKVHLMASTDQEPTANGEPDVVELSATASVARALAAGELSPNTAWMTGRLKASGPTGPLLALLSRAAELA